MVLTSRYRTRANSYSSETLNFFRGKRKVRGKRHKRDKKSGAAFAAGDAGWMERFLGRKKTVED